MKMVVESREKELKWQDMEKQYFDRTARQR